MKQVVLMLSLISFLGLNLLGATDKEPYEALQKSDEEIVQEAYLSACQQMGKQLKEFCECSYEQLRLAIPEDEFIVMMRDIKNKDNEEATEILRQASLKCEDKMPDLFYVRPQLTP